MTPVNKTMSSAGKMQPVIMYSQMRFGLLLVLTYS